MQREAYSFVIPKIPRDPFECLHVARYTGNFVRLQIHLYIHGRAFTRADRCIQYVTQQCVTKASLAGEREKKYVNCVSRCVDVYSIRACRIGLSYLSTTQNIARCSATTTKRKHAYIVYMLLSIIFLTPVVVNTGSIERWSTPKRHTDQKRLMFSANIDLPIGFIGAEEQAAPRRSTQKKKQTNRRKKTLLYHRIRLKHHLHV